MSRRRVAIGLAGLAVVVVSVAGFTWASVGGEEVALVVRRDLVETVDVSGKLESVRSLAYGPPNVRYLWNFTVVFMAPEGSEVTLGDPVLGFDATELEQRLVREEVDRDAAEKSIEKRTADLEIQLREAELALAEARATLERATLKTEVPEEIVATAELEKARLDKQLAASDVEYRTSTLEYLERRAEAELALLGERRDRAASVVDEIEHLIDVMTVRATREGTVIYKTRDRGEKKKVGDRSWRGERIVEIPDLAQMQVVAEVEEAESGRLSVGQRAELILDALPDRVFGARVERIHQTIEQRSWRDRRKVMRLELSLDETEPALMRPGMRMQGTIEISRSSQVLAVPASAVKRGVTSPQVEVFSRLGGGTLRRVALGRRSGDWVEVVEGLDEGERVALDG